MSNLKLSPPWVVYYNQIVALFAKDDSIVIGQLTEMDDGVYSFYITVESESKFHALNALLKKEIQMGNITLQINVICPEVSYADMVNELFKDNDIYNKMEKLNTPMGECNYAMFNKEVIQYFADNIADPNGNYSVLAQDIASNIFITTDVNYCTDIIDKRFEN